MTSLDRKRLTVTPVGRRFLVPFVKGVFLSLQLHPGALFLNRPLLSTSPPLVSQTWLTSGFCLLEPRHEFAFSYYVAEGKFVYRFVTPSSRFLPPRRFLPIPQEGLVFKGYCWNKQVTSSSSVVGVVPLIEGKSAARGTLRGVTAQRSLLTYRTSE